MMNYILQINAFWEKFGSLPNGKPYHITLYFALLKINNACGWKQVFRIDFDSVIELTRLDKNTYYKSCQFLHDNGFLEMWQKGKNRFDSALFSVRLLYDISDCKQNEEIVIAETKRNIPKDINNKKNKSIYPHFFEIEKFFLENNSSSIEAEKFFNYNESRKWAGIENWQPIAKNWILKNNENLKLKENGIKTSNKQNKSRLHVGEQDYSSKF